MLGSHTPKPYAFQHRARNLMTNSAITLKVTCGTFAGTACRVLDLLEIDEREEVSVFPDPVFFLKPSAFRLYSHGF